MLSGSSIDIVQLALELLVITMSIISAFFHYMSRRCQRIKNVHAREEEQAQVRRERLLYSPIPTEKVNQVQPFLVSVEL